MGEEQDIWTGPTGYNPKLGYVVKNEPVSVPEELQEEFKDFLDKPKKEKTTIKRK